MALINIATFSGMRPAVAPHLLDSAEAQQVQGADLAQGDLRPLHLHEWRGQSIHEVRSLWMQGDTLRLYRDRRRFVESKAGEAPRLFSSLESGGLRMQTAEGEEMALGLTAPSATPLASGLFSRTGSVSFVENGFSLAANFSLYPDDLVSFSGNVPSGLAADTPYIVLALVDGVYSISSKDKPNEALTFNGSGTATLKVEPSDVTTDRAYVFTVVNAFGDESAPSMPSAGIRMNSAQGATISGLIYARHGDEAPIKAKRLYRTATGSKETSFLFVAELEPNITVYQDALSDNALAEVLPSEFWDAPLPKLRHLTALPGGMLAAHDGTQVCLSSPNRPYAWPVDNHFSVGGVVALGVSQRTIFALTSSNVHALTVDEQVYQTTLDGFAPCIGPDGVTSTPMGVLFPSSDGLYLVAQGATSPQNMTDTLIGEHAWKELNPTSFLSVYFDTTYMAFFKKKNGEKGALLLDFGQSGQARMRFLDSYGSALQVIPSLRRVFMAHEGGNSGHWLVYEMFASENMGSVHFDSKRFILPAPVNMATLYVDGDTLILGAEGGQEGHITFWGGPIGEQVCADVPFGGEQSDRVPGANMPTSGTIRLLGDGKLRAEVPIRPGRCLALPGGYSARIYELQIYSHLPIRRVAVATTTGEVLT